MSARAAPRRDGGFALLALMAVIGVGTVGLLIAVQAFVRPGAGLTLRAEHNLQTAADAVRRSFLDGGAFAATLDDAATAGGLDPTALWRQDPFSTARDLEYRRLREGRHLRSRGPDGRRNTADDLEVVVAAEPIVRQRQRGRLRLIRAVLSRSGYRHSAAMTSADAAAMRTAMRDHAIARRRWNSADAAARAVLQVTLDDTAARIEALRVTWSLPALPTRVTGATGLMAQLGMPDARAYGGNGRTLLADPVLGVRARGYDRRGGTDDDM